MKGTHGASGFSSTGEGNLLKDVKQASTTNRQLDVGALRKQCECRHTSKGCWGRGNRARG